MATAALFERDPDALAIVDASVRFTYAQWYRRISVVVAGFDELGLNHGLRQRLFGDEELVGGRGHGLERRRGTRRHER